MIKIPFSAIVLSYKNKNPKNRLPSPKISLPKTLITQLKQEYDKELKKGEVYTFYIEINKEDKNE